MGSCKEVTEEEYGQALKDKQKADEVIRNYFLHQQEKFEIRLRENPVFEEDELFYSARARCECGAGLAYPRNCGGNHYWECSAILKGTADETVQHIDRLPFAFYKVQGENTYAGTTRESGVVPERD